jgi:hypothetical protein
MGCCRCRPAEGERRGWWKGSALGGRLGGALFCSFAACLLVLGSRKGDAAVDSDLPLALLLHSAGGAV